MSTFSDGEERRKSGVKYLSRVIDTREINACKINRYKMYIFKIIIVTELNSTSTTVSATSLAGLVTHYWKDCVTSPRLKE